MREEEREEVIRNKETSVIALLPTSQTYHNTLSVLKETDELFQGYR
jgi:hypothetical protein